MGMGGTETYLMNIYRHIDRNVLQFDFLTYYTKGQVGYYDEEIIKLGGKIHNIDPVSKAGPIKFINDIRDILKQNNYVAVHAHTSYNIGFSMLAAKLEKIDIRIAHSHHTKPPVLPTIPKRIYGYLMHYLINKYANIFCACSKKAAEFLFTKKHMHINYIFLPNAVDTSKFLEMPSLSSSTLKNSLNIPVQSKVIGHVGRYGKAKNHEFIIDMFCKMLQKREDVYLVLIGDGPTKEDIDKRIQSYKIQDHVRVLGIRNDIADLMNMMEVFILPSHYEGFGIVLLEAQASGLPCVVSENIQPETDMNLGLIYWVNLDDTEKWIQTIEENLEKKIKDKFIIKKAINTSPYKLSQVVNKFYDLYEIKVHPQDIL